jgi:hypothetical protein
MDIVAVNGEEVKFRIHDLDLRRRDDVTYRHDPFPINPQVQVLRAFTFHNEPHLFEAQHYLDDIFPHTGDNSEFVRNIHDPHGGDGGSLQRGKQHTSQGISQGHSIPTLHRADDIPAILLGINVHLYFGQNWR